MPAPGRDHWLAEQWANAFARSVQDMTGQPTSFAISDSDEAPTSGEGIRWRRQTLNIPESGPFWVGAVPSTVSEIGKSVLAAAGIDDADQDTIDGTFTEILSQAQGTLVRVLTATLGREVQGIESAEVAPEGEFACFEVQVTGGTSPVAVLRFAVSTRLRDTLTTSQERQPEPSPADGEVVPAPAAVDAAANRKGRSIDLLLDVELPVSVSFGRAQLALKDVIKLTTGSIVELNRSITEPVDVIVNNCVIARGEVVVVEGNFGVRIHQVISRQERLRTLR